MYTNFITRSLAIVLFGLLLSFNSFGQTSGNAREDGIVDYEVDECVEVTVSIYDCSSQNTTDYKYGSQYVFQQCIHVDMDGNMTGAPMNIEQAVLALLPEGIPVSELLVIALVRRLNTTNQTIIYVDQYDLPADVYHQTAPMQSDPVMEAFLDFKYFCIKGFYPPDFGVIGGLGFDFNGSGGNLFDPGASGGGVGVNDPKNSLENVKGGKTAASTISVSELVDANIYPNPFGNVLEIQNKNETALTVSIYNVQSKLVYQGTVEGASSTSISTTALPTGTYFVLTQNETLEHKEMTKVMKY